MFLFLGLVKSSSSKEWPLLGVAVDLLRFKMILEFVEPEAALDDIDKVEGLFFFFLAKRKGRRVLRE